MKKNSDFAIVLLRKARQDATIIEKLSADKDITDEAIGFHFQQAVEKSLKALLAINDIEFRRTHDIRELLDLIKDGGIEIPLWFETLDAWSSFAAEYRYDDIPEGEHPPIQRESLARHAFSIIKYVEDFLP